MGEYVDRIEALIVRTKVELTDEEKAGRIGTTYFPGSFTKEEIRQYMDFKEVVTFVGDPYDLGQLAWAVGHLETALDVAHLRLREHESRLRSIVKQALALPVDYSDDDLLMDLGLGDE